MGRIDWYLGHLIIPAGKEARYVHLGYATTYKKYRIVTVVDGEVTAMRKVRLKEFKRFRRSQFAAFKETEIYAKNLASVLEDGDFTEKEAEKFLFDLWAGYYLAVINDDKPLAP